MSAPVLPSAASPPVLETTRLGLRRLRLEDAAFMLRIWNDPAFLRHVGDRGLRTEDDARRALEEGPLRLYREHGYGPYVLSLRPGTEPIGICGLFRRVGLPDPDIGFALLPAFCGQGYAREAAEAVLAEARDTLMLSRVTAIVAPENDPSLALIRKLGFTYERMLRLPGAEREACLYGLDWAGPDSARGG